MGRGRASRNTRGDLADYLPRDRTTYRNVHVRGQPALRLDRREVLHRETRAWAQLLRPPVHQLRKVHRIQRRPPVVIPFRVNGHPLPRTIRPWEGDVNVMNIEGATPSHRRWSSSGPPSSVLCSSGSSSSASSSVSSRVPGSDAHTPWSCVNRATIALSCSTGSGNRRLGRESCSTPTSLTTQRSKPPTVRCRYDAVAGRAIPTATAAARTARTVARDDLGLRPACGPQQRPARVPRGSEERKKRTQHQSRPGARTRDPRLTSPATGPIS